MHRLITSGILIGILWSSCTRANKFSTQLVEVGEFVLPMDTLSSFEFRFVSEAIVDSKEYLVYINHIDPALYFYDFDLKQYRIKLRFDEKGPNAIPQPRGAYVVNFDSIFVISTPSYNLHLIDTLGRVKGKMNVLNNKESSEFTGTMRPYTASPGYFYGGYLFVASIPDRNPNSPNFYLGSIGIVCDFRNDIVDYIGQYPNEYQNSTWGYDGPTFTTCSNEGRVHFSFVFSDSLSIYSIETGKWGRVLAMEPNNPISIKSFKYTDDPDEYGVVNSFYHNILYDKYNKVYYRVRDTGLPYRTETGYINQYYNKPFEILIFDEDMHYLGKSQFDENEYDTRIMFVTKMGLMISKMNPMQNAYDENGAVFAIYNLEL